MSQAVDLELVSDQATPTLAALLRDLTPGPQTRALLAACAGAVRNRLRQHFRAREQGPSRRRGKGWRSKYFWYGSHGQSVAEKTQIQNLQPTSVDVDIASPEFAFKVKGGTITPKRGKYLALPRREEAYNAGSPREWQGEPLFPVRSKKGRLFLATRSASGGIVAQYLLVRSVTQDPDPQALPPLTELSLAAETAAVAWRDRRAQAAA